MAIRQEKLEAIMDAAKKMFARYGLRKTSMDELAQRARVAKATIYSHFGSKSRVYQEVLKREADEIVSKISERIARESSPADKLRAFIKIRFTQMIKALNLLNLSREGVEKALPAAMDIRDQLFERETQIIFSILKEGVDEGIFHIHNVFLTARAICHALRGFELNWLVQKSEEKIDAYLEELLNLIFYGLMGRQANVGAT